MREELMFHLALIFFLGCGSLWIGWRLKLPGILLLLISGVLAGPVLELLDPDRIFGPVLFPLVSLSVAVILFEGGLSLKLDEIRTVGTVVWKLVFLGGIITWILSGLAAHALLGFSPPISALFGAILIVSGPTVVIPLLNYIRPNRQIASVAKWEGIVNDPFGALAAVLVFELILVGVGSSAGYVTLKAIFMALVAGGVTGLLGAVLLMESLRKLWVPDYLENPLALAILVVVYSVSDHFQPESGLFAVTLMGALLANQKKVSIRHIIEFKETLRVMLIAALFIILSARISMEDIRSIGLQHLVFFLVLVLLIRPVAVWISTMKSSLNRRERVFLMLLAPRGIVAAAVASVFALELGQRGIGASGLVPATFAMVFGTVLYAGLLCPFIANRLRIATPNPQGCILLGAHYFSREIAKILKKYSIPCLLVDRNPRNVSIARDEGLNAYGGNVLSETIFEELDLDGIGRFLALTPNDEVNALACLNFSHIFGKNEVYQLSQNNPQELDTQMTSHLSGRILFGENVTFNLINRSFKQGGRVLVTEFNEEFDPDDFYAIYGDTVIPLFVISPDHKVTVLTGTKLNIGKGNKLVSLVNLSVSRES